MSVPPTRPPSSSSSGSSESSDKADKGKPKKDFKLPGKREEKEEKKEEDTGVFDLPAKKVAEQLKQQEALQAQETQASAALEAKEGVSKIMAIVQSMATQLQVGTIGGKDFASLELKTTADVPTFFQGAQLTLQQTSGGLIIRFDNLQQQAAAIHAVEQNKEQLASMIQNLQAKNIQVAELHLGNHQVSLPKVGEPAPVQAPQGVQEERFEREGHGQGGGEGQQEEQGPSE